MHNKKRTKELIKLKIPENIQLFIYEEKEFEELRKKKDPFDIGNIKRWN